MEARLRAVAAALEGWLNSFQKLAEREDLRQADLPHFPADEFLPDLQEAAFGVLRAGGDPVPVVGKLVGFCREHNAKIVTELEKCAETRGEITVERVGWLKRAYLSELEIGIRQLLLRLRLAVALVRFRSAQNLSLRELERLSGVSASYLSQIERGISGVPSPEVLAQLDATLAPAGGGKTSLLQILNRSENGLRRVQEEAVRLSGILHRLMGGGIADEPFRRWAGRQAARREAFLEFCCSSRAPYARPSERLRRFASRSDDQVLEISTKMAPPLFGDVSDELYDAVRRLNPELQRVLLGLVKEMLRVQEAGSRKPERGGEGQKD
ncbi:MAG: helix-turn-helix transcriptional regulator [Bacillota bacterium]